MSHLASLVADHRVVVCVGSGGVGKTTSAAALALWGALNGRRTAVLTIDPAKRLADCLGLDPTETIGTHSQPLGPEVFAPYGITPSGTLTALLVEQDSAWKAAIERYIIDPELRARIFANRFYQGLSQTFAGSHEYMALDTLAGLLQQETEGTEDAENAYDLIVVDTPPTRQAIDFLEAPRQLQRLLDHQMVQRFLGSSEKIGETSWAGWSVVQRTSRFLLSKIEEATGISAFREIVEFCTTLEHMFGDFGQRFSRVSALLESPETAFVLVTSPEEEVLIEAGEMCRTLERLDLGLKAVVVNRVHEEWESQGKGQQEASRVLKQLHKTISFPLKQQPQLAQLNWLADNFLAYQALARGEQRRVADFGRHLPADIASPALSASLIRVPAVPAFPADLGGLLLFHTYLFRDG